MMMDELGPPMLFDVMGGLHTLWRRRRIVVAALLAALALGIVYLAVTKPTYTAEASILVDTRDTRATNLDSVLPGIGADSAAIASQVSVIQSRDVLGAVFDAEGLATDPEFAQTGLTSKLLAWLGIAPPAGRDAIYGRFQDQVSVQREGLTYVIDISFKSHDPEKAARIVNAIVARYQARLAGEQANANEAVNGLLSGKIGSLQDDVAHAERAVVDFKTTHHIFDATTGGTLQSQIDQTTTQLLAAQDQASQAQDKYNQAVAAGKSPEGLLKLFQMVSSTATDKLRDDYNQRAAALANAQALYGPRHPTIISQQAELQKLGTLMAREADRIIEELRGSRDLAAQNVAKIKANLSALRQQASQSDLDQVQLRDLQGKADAARAVLDDFLRRSQETSQMQGLQISQVRVISGAVPPAQPSWPKPMLLLPVSALLGLLAGCGLALLLGAPVKAPRPLPAPVPPPTTPPVDRTPPKPSPPPTPPAARPPPPAPSRRSRIPGLGAIRLSDIPGDTPEEQIRAARVQIAVREEAPVARAVQRVLKHVLARLGRHAAPYLILVRPADGGSEARVLAQLLGIGLRRAGARPLLVSRPGAGRALPTPLAPGRVAVDASSGLDLVEGPGRLDSAAARAMALQDGLAFDFILVDGASFVSPDLAAEADFELIVCSAEGQQILGEADLGPGPHGDPSRRASVALERAAAAVTGASRPMAAARRGGGRAAAGSALR